jgi:hypothetical protein
LKLHWFSGFIAQRLSFLFSSPLFVYFRIFELAPGAFKMYGRFSEGYTPDDDEFYRSEGFLAHARGVVRMLDAAVNMMGPDLEPVAEALYDLGAQHLTFGVLPAHYGIVGEALLFTLATALGDKWTPKVKKGWTGIYTFISSNMMLGAERRIAERKEIRIRREAAKSKDARTSRRLSNRNLPKGLIRATKQSNDAESIIDQVLNVCQYTASMPSCDDSTAASSTSTTASDTLEANEISLSKVVEAVYMSWDKVKRIPNYKEVAGVLLFKK